MAKLATLSALLLLAMVAMATATTYTTITTTTIDDVEATNKKRSDSQEQISHCRMLIQCEGERRHGSLRMVVNPRSTSQCEEEHLEDCCAQLGRIEKDDRCQAIEDMVREDQGTQQRRQMMQMAQDLPNRCRMEPRQCDMQQGPWF